MAGSDTPLELKFDQAKRLFSRRTMGHLHTEYVGSFLRERGMNAHDADKTLF